MTKNTVEAFATGSPDLAAADREVRAALFALMEYFKKVLPKTRRHELPWGYTFQHWEGGSYTLRKGVTDEIRCMTQAGDQNDGSIECFIHDINNGWLSEVGKLLEEKVERLQNAQGQMKGLIAKA